MDIGSPPPLCNMEMHSAKPCWVNICGVYFSEFTVCLSSTCWCVCVRATCDPIMFRDEFDQWNCKESIAVPQCIITRNQLPEIQAL